MTMIPSRNENGTKQFALNLACTSSDLERIMSNLCKMRGRWALGHCRRESFGRYVRTFFFNYL